MENSSATIFIVDDDADLCRALGRLLRSAGYATRTYYSATRFLAEHDPEPAGCILMDIAMPDIDGLQVQMLLNASGNVRPIVFLTGNATVPLTVAAMRAGAVNLLPKPVHERKLFEAIDEALQIDAVEHSARRLRAAIRERLASLTPRERQVLEHVLHGRLNKQIAADLGTVEKTVKVHRARVMHKMRARSVAELVQLASAGGIVPESWSTRHPSQLEWPHTYGPHKTHH